MRQTLLQSLQDMLACGEIPVIGVVTFYDRPWRFGGTGLAQNMAGNGTKLVVQLDMLLVLFGDPPAGVGIFFQFFDALLLLFLGQMEPELENQGAFVDQHFFKACDLVQRLG